MKYELHFAEKDLQEDIKCYKVANQSDLINLINGYGEAPKMLGNFSKHKEVYLCAIELYHNDNDGIIFVDDKPEYIVSFIKDNTNTPTMKKIFLQVYESYEEAYEVAMTMKEVSPIYFAQELGEVQYTLPKKNNVRK